MKKKNIGAELRELNISLLRHLAKNKAKPNKEKPDCPDETRGLQVRSEERGVGKECRSRWSRTDE